MKKILFLSVLFSSLFSFAQYGIVNGIVVDDITPISDITVQIKGTSITAITDFDGKFRIKAAIGSILIFSHISYRTQEIKVTDYYPLKIKMLDGYYEMVIYTKEKKYFFTLDYITDIKNETNGISVNLYLPKLFKKLKPQLIYTYQKGKSNFSKTSSEIRLEHLFRIFRKSIDLNLIYNDINLNRFRFKKNLIETQFGKRISRQYFDFYVGFGKVELNNQHANIYEIGINKNLFKLLNLYTKTGYFNHNYQFQNGLNMYYKNFNFQFEHNIINKYNGVNIAFGYLLKF